MIVFGRRVKRSMRLGKCPRRTSEGRVIEQALQLVHDLDGLVDGRVQAGTELADSCREHLLFEDQRQQERWLPGQQERSGRAMAAVKHGGVTFGGGGFEVECFSFKSHGRASELLAGLAVDAVGEDEFGKGEFGKGDIPKNSEKGTFLICTRFHN